MSCGGGFQACSILSDRPIWRLNLPTSCCESGGLPTLEVRNIDTQTKVRCCRRHATSQGLGRGLQPGLSPVAHRHPSTLGRVGAPSRGLPLHRRHHVRLRRYRRLRHQHGTRLGGERFRLRGDSPVMLPAYAPECSVVPAPSLLPLSAFGCNSLANL